MVKSRHLRCPHCGFLDTIKRGTRLGYTRYYCKSCASYFTARRPHISDINKQVWFREWVGGKQSIEQLSNRSGYSIRHLKSYFHSQLPKCPVWHIQRREKVNLLIDGTYFPNKVCLVLYRDANIRMTIFYRLTDGEHLRELKEDLANPEMFSYTRSDKIPKSSNSIESFFGHLKDNLRLHRGLSKDHLKDFVKWYLFFKSNVDKINKK